MDQRNDTRPEKEQLAALEERVAVLEEALRHADEELRTRRLVITDEAGGERITACAAPGYAELRVLANDDTTVSLIGTDESKGDGPAWAGVFLLGRGDERAALLVDDCEHRGCSPAAHGRLRIDGADFA